MAPPVERLRTGGSRAPIAIAVSVIVGLGIVAWRPWGPVGPSGQASVSVPSAIPSQPGAASPTPEGVGAYVSLTDNEWTVVALLTPDATAASTEEPATQHLPPWWPEGPFSVLQQGLNTVDPLRPGDAPPGPVCQSAIVPRFRSFVLLPADRVAYLGATFPGMAPDSVVGITSLSRPDMRFGAVLPLVVRIVGQPEGDRFALSAAGHGGAIMLATSPPQALPPGTYRIDVTSPESGRRLLYACVGA